MEFSKSSRAEILPRISCDHNPCGAEGFAGVGDTKGKLRRLCVGCDPT